MNKNMLLANTDLLHYVLQDDVHNRPTPRVIDIAYTAFMLAKNPNDEDGGPSDWFTDTRPKILAVIEKLRKELLEDQAKKRERTPQMQAAVRKVLQHHGVTELGDGVLEADLIYAVLGGG